jgi:hypothetical protein
MKNLQFFVTSRKNANSVRLGALLAVFLLTLCLPVLHAQLYTGSVSGTVTDPSGAAVPSANLTLTDVDKGFTYRATSDSDGRYLMGQVPPGTYNLSIETPNFQSQRKEAIKIDVNQNVSINFALKIGLATETVDVVANAVHLQTEDAVTGQVVNRKFVNDLPLVNRNFTNLAYLAPGVNETNAPGTTNANGGINFNSNGSRNSTADVLIDGASATNFEQNSGIQNVPYTPSVDSVEEFKVQQSNFTAEFGFAGGTVINVVTRSGTNQYHGSAYEFFRNSALNANEWFANRDGNARPASRRNNFGATFGGPIKRDKTFFFVDYEGLRQSSFASSRSGVPTLCERGTGPCPAGQTGLGNFSEVCTLQGGTFNGAGQCSAPEGQLWDPFTGVFNSDPSSVVGADPGTVDPGAVRTAFIPFNDLSNYASPGNPALAGTQFQPAPLVKGNLIDPVAAKLFQLYPLPTSEAASLDDLQNANFSTAGTRGDRNDQFDIKVDHRFSDRNVLSVRYSQANSNSTSFNCYKNFADPCTGGPSESNRHLLTINHTHTFSPTMVLTVTYGWVRGFDFSHGVGGEFSNFNELFASTGFPSYLDKGFKTLPVIDLSGGGYNAGIGSQAFAILREGQDSHHLGGAVSWIHGRHDLKFGAEGRLHRINFVQPGWPSGEFDFNRASTSQVSTLKDSEAGGDALASFLTGVGDPTFGGGGCTPCQVGLVNFVSTQSFRTAVFAQDNFRVTPKLTLNLGLRYELSTPRTERYNRMNSLDPNAASPLQLTDAQLALAPDDAANLSNLKGVEVFANSKNRSNYDTFYHAIQPRFGLAYQLPHSFVIRGGYGIYFSTPRSGASGTGPWGFQGFDVQPPWLTSLNIDHVTPFNTLKNTSCLFSDASNCGVAAPPGSSLGGFNDIGFAAAGPVKAISHDIPYEQAWSIGFQKELPGKILFDASYVGKKGTHLYLGGFREMNFLPQSVLSLSTADISALNDNVPNPFYFNPALHVGQACDPSHFICDQTSGLAGPEVSAWQLKVPHPQYNGFQGDSPPIANSIYHALQVRVEREFSNGLQFLLTYTWSKSIDDASATDDSISWLGGGTTDGSTLQVQNPYDLRGERAESVYNIPHTLQFSFVYELPVGKGRRYGSDMHPVLNAVVGGWQLNGIVRIDNGRPIIPGLDSPNSIPTFGQRPNLTGTLKRGSAGPADSTDPDTGVSYFGNPDSLSQPDANTFGSSARTLSSVRQPGARDVSMSLFKDFPMAAIREGMRMQFRLESFNTFNHPHFAGPNANVGASDFGFISSTLGSPRQLQLALKLYF